MEFMDVHVKSVLGGTVTVSCPRSCSSEGLRTAIADQFNVGPFGPKASFATSASTSASQSQSRPPRLPLPPFCCRPSRRIYTGISLDTGACQRDCSPTEGRRRCKPTRSLLLMTISLRPPPLPSVPQVEPDSIELTVRGFSADSAEGLAAVRSGCTVNLIPATRSG